MRRFCGLAMLAGVLMTFTGCETSVDETGTIQAVANRHRPELMAIPGVVGVGVGEARGTEVIVVYVSERTPEVESDVPRVLEGYMVVIRVVGPIVPLGIPSGAAYIQGAITSLDGGRALVEENPAEEFVGKKISLWLAADTRILYRSGGVARKTDLAVGQLVSAWVDGPVLESYPEQGEASVIVIEP